MRRNKALREFYSQANVRVILLSLTDAASGTNLQQASHVVLMDPIGGVSKEEADAIEAQAIGRAHRQGQTKKLQVIRLVARDTVEHELALRQPVVTRKAQRTWKRAVHGVLAAMRFKKAGEGEPKLTRRAESYNTLAQLVRATFKATHSKQAKKEQLLADL
mmetsp:Transcript_11974/g.22858  ORF Transcript_11974/g.22858 Transcript_11974/m.22858 type:complete len:161 (-) Transcript_11974:293-775(-)